MFKNYTLIIFFLVIGIQLTVYPTLQAQTIQSITDVPGGGGSTAVNNDESNPNTILYVMAGLVVFGVLVYKFILEEPAKDDPPAETEDEGEKASSQLQKIKSFNEEVMIAKEKIPLDIHIGVLKNKFAPGDNSIVMGLTFNF